jgi:hypothetical protein
MICCVEFSYSIGNLGSMIKGIGKAGCLTQRIVVPSHWKLNMDIAGSNPMTLDSTSLKMYHMINLTV